MKNIFLLLTIFLMISCDDGDLIVTDFDFEDKDLSSCGDEKLLLFNINNNDGVNEAIAFVYEVSLEIDDLDGIGIDEVLQGEIPINEQNQIIYRTFDGEVGQDYFCDEIPPINPGVVEEYRSTTGGTIIVSITRNNEDDHDGDGVPTSVENAVEAEYYVDGFPDTDNDGIPNYLDIDDDGDNVLTSVEISDNIEAEFTADGYPDTDGDGIPNYLDPDDDGDDVPTINEDEDSDGNVTEHTNEEGLPHYLNPDISISSEAVPNAIENTISRSFRYRIDIQNITLVRQGGNGEQIRLEDYYFGFFDSAVEEITYPLEEEDDENDNGDEEDNDEEEDEDDGEEGNGDGNENGNGE